MIGPKLFSRRWINTLVMGATLAFLSACDVPSINNIKLPSLDLNKPIPVALLIPQSAPDVSSVANSLEQATRLAISQLSNVKIDLRVYDTAGSAELAAIQAQTAVDEGAKIILGPLFAEAANAAGLAVADENVTVLSFSNNSSIAGGNVFILGKTFDNTAKRITQFAASQGKRRGVIVYPETLEGQYAKVAIEQATMNTNLQIVSAQGFAFTREGVANTVPLIRAAVEIEQADLLILTSPSAGALPLLAQMLPESGLSPETIQYTGLARWDIPAQNLGLAGLQGGWFALPQDNTNKTFSDHYLETYGQQPHPLAGLAFDGIAAIAALVQTGNTDALNANGLTQPAGFSGVDGIFRFNADGTNERGLAIAEIREKQVYIIDNAPRSFAIPGL